MLITNNCIIYKQASYLYFISNINEGAISFNKKEINKFINSLNDKNNITIGIYVKLYGNNDCMFIY